jgi:uncharacterized membrane protein
LGCYVVGIIVGEVGWTFAQCLVFVLTEWEVSCANETFSEIVSSLIGYIMLGTSNIYACMYTKGNVIERNNSHQRWDLNSETRYACRVSVYPTVPEPKAV